MSFEKKDWKDRIAEYINRRRITHEDGTSELITVERDEGTISLEGDAFNAENMNEFEERIAKALTPLDSMSAINANTQDNQLAGAKAVKELSETLDYVELTKGFDLNNATSSRWYRSSKSETVASLVNTPTTFLSGEVVIEWRASESSNNYGSQIIYYTNGTTNGIYTRNRNNTTWSDWESLSTNKDLANYLPLTGGTLSGDLTIGDGSIADRTLKIRSNTRLIGLNAFSSASASSAGLYDFVNSWWLLSNDGTNDVLYNNGKKVLTAADFVVSGSTSEAKLTINLD